MNEDKYVVIENTLTEQYNLMLRTLETILKINKIKDIKELTNRVLDKIERDNG